MRHSQPVDLTTLTPVQRMELADALYDSAMQEIESVEPLLTAEQRLELDRRLDRLHSGGATLVSWDDAYSQFATDR
jgi:putative addiction module component (TIGR02574 family)